MSRSGLGEGLGVRVLGEVGGGFQGNDISKAVVGDVASLGGQEITWRNSWLGVNWVAKRINRRIGIDGVAGRISREPGLGEIAGQISRRMGLLEIARRVRRRLRLRKAAGGVDRRLWLVVVTRHVSMSVWLPKVIFSYTLRLLLHPTTTKDAEGGGES